MACRGVSTGQFVCRVVGEDRELEAALEVRRKVFVNEQGVPGDIEFDGGDAEALHVVVTSGESVIGTARVRFPGGGPAAKLERMAVLPDFRRCGAGKAIVSYMLDELEKRHVRQVVLHAQCAAVSFYRSCGFAEVGSPFWEAGIKHIKMRKRLD
ncbi:MAG: GNAT family N-acetyltransferase [Chloroflexota bacterium]